MIKICMKILSIDVGMKCLAYCILSIDDKEYKIEKWGILDLCNEKHHKCCGQNKKRKKPCEKNSKYHKNSQYFCKIHAKTQNYIIPTNELKPSYIKKSKVDTLKHICKKYDMIENIDKKKFKKSEYQNLIYKKLEDNYLSFVQTVKTNSINLVTYGQRLKIGFEKLLKDIDIDRVIVENQIGPLALRMKTLQGMIMQHFIEKGCPIIEEISASNKLKDYITKKKTKYAERKKLSISVTKNILETNTNLQNWILVFLEHKKKDDLADSFLQGLWYFKYRILLSDNN